MEKRAENTFVAGLNTDRHPLTSQKTELIDAQNIDLIAIGEGYQLILQKREGNIELFLLPPIWNKLYTYLTNEYVTYGGVTYKSLIDGNQNIIPVDGLNWQLQPTLLVSAGLRPGYIPLAVKEFNNIAYIVSVNPDTLMGEVGTFPSPDYSAFIYETGSPLTPGAEVEDPSFWVWDPRINPPDYQFTLTGIPGSGEDEAIHSNMALYVLTKAGFTIKNTGTLSDTYSISRVISVSNGTLLFQDGVFFDYSTQIVTLAPGESTVFTVKHSQPYTAVGSLIYYPPNVLEETFVTVTSIGNPITDAKTYEYEYHIESMLQVLYDTAPAEISVNNVGGPPITVSHRIPYAGGSTTFVWSTNDSAVASVATPALSILPLTPGSDTHGVRPGDSISIFGNDVLVTFAANVVPAFRHTVGFSMYTNTGSASVTLYVEQESH